MTVLSNFIWVAVLLVSAYAVIELTAAYLLAHIPEIAVDMRKKNGS